MMCFSFLLNLKTMPSSRDKGIPHILSNLKLRKICHFRNSQQFYKGHDDLKCYWFIWIIAKQKTKSNLVTQFFVMRSSFLTQLY